MRADRNLGFAQVVWRRWCNVDLAGIRRAKWTKTPSLVARKAMLKVRRRLFGQSLKGTFSEVYLHAAG